MAGQVQRIDGELMIPAEDREEAEFVAEMAGQLAEIHVVPRPFSGTSIRAARRLRSIC